MKVSEKLVIHPAPVEEESATDYALTVNGLPVFTHRARVSAQPFNQVWPGYQRPLDQTEIASFATWDMAEPVRVKIVSTRPVKEVRVRPRSYGIKPQVKGDTIRFTVRRPGQLTVEVNGTHRALHLFANPLEEDAPDPKDSRVRYFGPGVHCPGIIRLESDQIVYLAGGAVVYGAIAAEKADHIAIRGRGILDGSKFSRSEVGGLLNILGCTGVTIEGIILRDPVLFAVAPVVCREVHIRNIKLIGLWRYNSDGIDFINSRQCSVEDSFVRSFDDSIVFKGLKAWRGFPGNAESVQDIQVRRCVVWNDWGRSLEIGAETVAHEISDLLFEDCDVIHTAHIAMDVQNCDRALCRNLVFRNIRVEFDDDFTRPVIQERREMKYAVKSGSGTGLRFTLAERKKMKYAVAPDGPYIPCLIVLEISECRVSKDTVRGHVRDILFKDIEVTVPGVPPSYLKGCDAEHLVQRVTVENLRINGRVVTSTTEGGFTLNKFARELSVKP
jgi:hypothetical protein